jgi:DNA-directed RNA polymerase III subunit RPC4
MIQGGASSRGGGGGAFGFGGGGFGGRSGGPGGNSSQYTYADGIVEDDRIDADQLRGSTPRDDEEVYTHGGAKVVGTKKRRGILPVGIQREEFREKDLELTTAEDIAAGESGAKNGATGGEEVAEDDDAMFVDEPRTKPDTEVWNHVAPKAREKVMIKNEHGELVEATTIDEIAAARAQQQHAPPSDEQDQDEEPAAKPKPVVKRWSEEDQIKQDMDTLASQLARNAILEQHHDEESNQSHPDSLEGNLFLFQLPPVLPPLKVARAPGPRRDAAGGFVKDEPRDDAVMLDQPRVNIDLTDDTPQPDVKDEEVIDETRKPSDKHEDPLYPPEGGYVGKLIVRKSGKVELDWGGQTLEVVRGLETNFLNTAVLVDEISALPKPGELNGAAYSMGKIAGKFVLAPKWGDEDDWDVDAEELAGGGVSWEELQAAQA